LAERTPPLRTVFEGFRMMRIMVRAQHPWPLSADGWGLSFKEKK
jgi:hypothetical protein